MSVLCVPDHFPRAKGCPAEAAALFACLHEHTAQTPDEIFDGGAKGSRVVRTRPSQLRLAAAAIQQVHGVGPGKVSNASNA